MGGGGLMKNLSEEDKRRNEKQFDAYIKKALKNKAIDIERGKKNRDKNKILFSDISDYVFNGVFWKDRYNFSENYFVVEDEVIFIENEVVTEGLKRLSNKKRLIILLFYFLEMNDREIGEYLNSVRSTVQTARKKALKDLKEYIKNEEERRKEKISGQKANNV